MKQFATLLVFALLLNPARAQRKETRSVPDFTSVSFGVSGKLYLRQGDRLRVELEGDEETLEKIETEVRGSRLVIRSADRWSDWWSWRDDKRVTVYITMKEIDGLSVSGSGDLVAQTPLTTGDLDLNVSGSGFLKAEFTANGDIEADVSGSGDMEIKGRCHNFESDISGSGSVYYTGEIAGRAEFDLTGSGKLQASGSANTVKAEISGSGRVIAGDLETDRCEVRISGSGDVQINVKSELDVNISGSGSVLYRGNPNHVNSNASGSGKVRKM